MRLLLYSLIIWNLGLNTPKIIRLLRNGVRLTGWSRESITLTDLMGRSELTDYGSKSQFYWSTCLFLVADLLEKRPVLTRIAPRTKSQISQNPYHNHENRDINVRKPQYKNQMDKNSLNQHFHINREKRKRTRIGKIAIWAKTGQTHIKTVISAYRLNIFKPKW